MTKIKILFDTWLKKKLLNSTELKPNEKKSIRNGEVIEVTWIIEAGKSQHYLIELTNKNTLEKEYYYVFKKHIKILDNNFTSKEIQLQVPYLSQRDNLIDPYKTCNVTCVAMILSYYGFNKQDKNKQLEDILAQHLLDIGANRYSHEVLRKLIEEYNLKDNFTMNGDYNEMKKYLLEGKPLIISGKFTASGHIIVLTGFNDKGFFVNDPYGNYMSKYTDVNGKNLLYTYKDIYEVSYGGSVYSWCHFINKV